MGVLQDRRIEFVVFSEKAGPKDEDTRGRTGGELWRIAGDRIQRRTL